MTDCRRIRRQAYALLAGGLAGSPIGIGALMVSWARNSPLDALGGPAGAHYGAIVLAIISLGSVAVLLNYMFGIAAGFVLASLAYDSYKLGS